MPANQHELLLTQNIGASEVEFLERYVPVSKGSIIIGSGDSIPIALTPGTNGQVLSADSTEANGLKWIDLAAGHTQNTDTGTTSQTFQLHTGSNGARIKSEGSNSMSARNNLDTAFADLEVKDLTAADITATDISLTTGSLSTTPSGTEDTDIANVAYVNSVMGASDAMVFKGSIGTDATLTIAAFNSLSTYDIGWTYKVVTEGTIRGKTALVGDMFVAKVKRTGSGAQDTDWAYIPSNMEGAVVGPANATNQNVAMFNGTSGKLIADSGYTIGVSVPSNAVFTDTTYTGSTSITLVGNEFRRAALTGDVTASVNNNATTISDKAVTLAKMADVATGTLFYRKTGGAGSPEVQTLATLKADLGAMPVEWVGVPATSTSNGTPGQVARDGNFLYVCTATNVWRRSVIASWTA